MTGPVLLNLKLRVVMYISITISFDQLKYTFNIRSHYNLMESDDSSSVHSDELEEVKYPSLTGEATRSKLVNDFADQYLRSLRENNQQIVASIGKQSSGKSFFLGRLFNDDDRIVNKHNECVTRGTNVLNSIPFDEFLLFDMEGLQGDMSSVERDILNFSATFALADVLLLHISQSDIESTIFLESISYSFWQSSKISSKFGLDLPKIILLIRDPRVSKPHKKTLKFYSKIVASFQEKVNMRVSEMENDYIRRINEVILKSPNSSKKKKKQATEAIENLSNQIPIAQFKISCYFCVYFRQGFVEEKSKYLQMKTSRTIEVSNFEDLSNKIKEYLQENLKSISIANEFSHGEFFGIENPNSQKIHEILCRYRCCSKEIIFKNVLLEIKYNVFSHFRNIDGYLRFIEKFDKYLVQFEKLNAKISKKIKDSKPGISTDKKIKKLKAEHAQCKNKIINEAFESEFTEYIPPYLKYLSAISFCDTFRLNQGIEDSFSYQALSTFILFSDPKHSDHQLTQIEKNINMYKCLEYYDIEFEEMIKTMLNYKFQLYKTIYSIYKTKILDLQKTNFRFKEDLDKNLGTLRNEMNLGDRISTLIRLLSLNDIYPSIDLFAFLGHLRNLHELLTLPNKGKITKS